MSSLSTAAAWFKKANQDLKVIRFLLDRGDSDVLESCAFHCQQSIEKSMKGFLVHSKVRSKKTHDLKLLSKNVLEIDDKLGFIKNNASLI